MEYAYYMSLVLGPVLIPLVGGIFIIWSVAKLKRIEKMLKKFEMPDE